MRLGIMQPYFMPYLGHFALISHTDYWIVFDITQYTRKSWMNRNRILHPNGGPQYITVPLKNSSVHIKTMEAVVEDSKDNILGKLSHYKRRAPFYSQVIDLVKQTYAETHTPMLVDLNVSSLRTVCRYLGIPFQYKICSELNLEYPEEVGPGDWAHIIAGQLGATTYINPMGGRDLFNVQDFRDKGIELKFLEFENFVYNTRGMGYEPGLSILDVLMFNSPEMVREVLKTNTKVISAGVLNA